MRPEILNTCIEGLLLGLKPDAAVLMLLQIRLNGTPEDKLRKSVARAA
jgi:hypothetical protein